MPNSFRRIPALSLMTFQRLGLVLLLPAIVANAKAGELPADLGKKLAHGYISPAMQHFRQSAEEMHAALQTWCAAPGTAGRQSVHDNFAQLVKAWSGIEFLRFGPLAAENHYEKINFWPDPRGVAQRQMPGMLSKFAAAPDPAAIALSSHSVAVQGLPALEYLLYRDGGLLVGEQAPRAVSDLAPATAVASKSPLPGEALASSNAASAFASACAYAISIAGNLAGLGTQLAQEWSPAGAYAQKFANPSSSNPLYRSQQEVAGEAVKALSTGLQFARDVKLLPVLGADIKAVRPKRAPFWRSGLASRSMSAAAQGMLRFYRAAGLLYGDDEAWIDASLQAELLRIVDDFNAMSASAGQMAQAGDAPVEWMHLLQTEAGYRRLTLAALLIKNAKSLLDQDAAPAFGVTIGFNALDGD